METNKDEIHEIEDIFLVLNGWTAEPSSGEIENVKLLEESKSVSFEQGQTKEFVESNRDKRLQTLKDVSSIGIGVAIAGLMLLTARGGNYKVVRQNLAEQNRLNAKQPLPKEQKKLRRAKRRK